MPELAPTEIKALARIVGELDYYQLLHLKRGATASEVKAAYHATSRTFHPDANRHLRPDLQDAVSRIARRVTEAYSVLRDPRRRRVYDERIAAGGGVRMQLAEASAAAERKRLQETGGHARTPQGRQFFQLAQADLRRGDLASAMRNLQTALTFEPGNASIQAELARVKERWNRSA